MDVDGLVSGIKYVRRLSILFLLTLLCSSAMLQEAPLHAQEHKATQSRATGRSPLKIFCCDRYDVVDNGKNGYVFVGGVNLELGVTPFVPTITPNNCSDLYPDYPNPGFTSEAAAAADPTIALSMNANFFWWDHEHNKNVHDIPCHVAIGLAISEGKIISRPGEGINKTVVLPDSILFYYNDKGYTPPSIIPQPGRGYVVPLGPPAVRTAVSGILIVVDGLLDLKRATEAKIEANENAPRTAIALNKPGNILYFAIAVGKGIPGYEGITLSGLADLLIKNYGVYTVLNLDGGGSSAFYYYCNDPLDPNCFQLMSSPNDLFPPERTTRQYRPVPINLSFKDGERTNYPFNQKFLGTPVTGNIVFKGMTIEASGAYSFLNSSTLPSTLTLEAKRQIILKPNTAVITNRDNSSGSFRAMISP